MPAHGVWGLSGWCWVGGWTGECLKGAAHGGREPALVWRGHRVPLLSSLLPSLPPSLPRSLPPTHPPAHPPTRNPPTAAATHPPTHAPGMVSEVSATLVATTIRRWPGGGAANTRAWAAGGSSAYSGSTSTGGVGGSLPPWPPALPRRAACVWGGWGWGRGVSPHSRHSSSVARVEGRQVVRQQQQRQQQGMHTYTTHPPTHPPT